MKNRLIIILAAISFPILFVSCGTNMLFTTLDVLRPAKVTFANDTEHLLIVNNSVVQPINAGHTTEYLNGEKKIDAVSTDSLALFALSVLSEELQNKDYFTTVTLELASVSKNTDFNTVAPLQYAMVRDLCKKYETDVVLSLDRIKVTDAASEYYYEEEGIYVGALDAKYESLWSIHYPDKVEVNPYVFRDSLYWETESYVRKNALDRLPKREDALIDGAILVGLNASDRLTPYWEKIDRYFFNPSDKTMKQGMDSVYVRNWDAAVQVWTTVFNNSNKIKLKAEAANNIAIGYEIIGDYDKAIEYAQYSFDYFIARSFTDVDLLLRIADYITELNRRKIEVDILKKQMGSEL